MDNMIIKENNIEKAKKKIKISEKPIILEALDDHFNRKMIEYGKFNVLLDIEKGERKDQLKQMDSGLNHYLAKEMYKNKIMLGFDLNNLNNMRRKEKAIRIGKIIQNIKLSRKSGTSITLYGIKNKKDAFALLSSLGASSKQASQAISF